MLQASGDRDRDGMDHTERHTLSAEPTLRILTSLFFGINKLPLSYCDLALAIMVIICFVLYSRSRTYGITCLLWLKSCLTQSENKSAG